MVRVDLVRFELDAVTDNMLIAVMNYTEMESKVAQSHRLPR